jgi:hypothetical protein
MNAANTPPAYFFKMHFNNILIFTLSLESSLFLKTIFFWNLKPSGLVDIYLRFGGTCCFLPTFKVDAAVPSEIPI